MINDYIDIASGEVIDLSLEMDIIIDKNENPTDDDINEAMIGNICRCGTYQRIKKAINRTVELKNQN